MARWAKEGARRLKNLAQMNCTKGLKGRSKGVTLIEVLLAVALLGIISTTFLSSLTTSYKAVAVGSERTNAESLTRSEFEYIKNSPYYPLGFSYEIPATPDDPPPWDLSRTALESHYDGYSIKVTGQPIYHDNHGTCPPGLDEGMQRITVKVYHEGNLVLTTSTYKVNR